MTLNILIHCRDGIVLACDSLASQITTVLLPNSGTPLIDQQTGKPIINPLTRKPVVDEGSLQRRETIINIFGNVNKLFQIKDYPIGAIISGLGQMGDDTFDDLFDEFESSIPSHNKPGKGKQAQTVVEVVNELTDFLKIRYSKAFPEKKNKKPKTPPLELLIGGYSKGQKKGELFRIGFPEGKNEKINDSDNIYAMAIGGQGDAIDRFIRGYTEPIANYIINQVSDQWQKALMMVHKNTINKTIKYFENKGIEIPKRIKDGIPKIKQVQMGLEVNLPTMTYNIEFRHMSLQDAVDFAMFLTTVTYGRQRFVSGIPTVGGKVNLATITRKEGFKFHTPQEINVTAINI